MSKKDSLKSIFNQKVAVINASESILDDSLDVENFIENTITTNMIRN